MNDVIHVVAAVIVDAAGQILIARRPESKHQGGLWEFPGGKVEVGETPLDALQRELHEELGIDVNQARPLIQILHRYPDKSVKLDVWRVDGFSGEAHGKEGQPVCWVDEAELDEYAFPAANKPIITALRLPERMLITGDCTLDEYPARVEAALLQGVRLVMLRAHDLDINQLKPLWHELNQICDDHNARLVLNSSIEVANELQAGAVHLTAERLGRLAGRDAFNGRMLSASCHSPQELEMAQQKGLDFVTLSPVMPTLSHPDQPALGWSVFSGWVENVTLPVYALGGMDESCLEQAWASGAQGVAGISSWW
ncbi:Nudix family hydrolase [Nitrincola sp. MINF-07-Sa-05]|uniref:Nudix family hydrolase n=1 Tax=Nitrincola salilacus TaxID=3400273 RepID=UPI0039184011